MILGDIYVFHLPVYLFLKSICIIFLRKGKRMEGHSIGNLFFCFKCVKIKKIFISKLPSLWPSSKGLTPSK